jgi:hypothetical protein
LEIPSHPIPKTQFSPCDPLFLARENDALFRAIIILLCLLHRLRLAIWRRLFILKLRHRVYDQFQLLVRAESVEANDRIIKPARY